MLKEDRRWLSDRQRLNATFSMFIKRMESLVRHCRMMVEEQKQQAFDEMCLIPEP